MYCIKKLTDDVLFNCQNKSVKGLEKRILLLNYLDIDRKATILNESKTTIEELSMKLGTRGYMLEGINNHFKGSQKLSKKAFDNEISVRVYQIDAHVLERVIELTKGNFVAIVETKNKGQNGENAFEVLGFDAGLRLLSIQRDYDKSSATLTFSSYDNVKESRMVYKWLEKNYSNTLKKFNAKLGDADNKIFDETFDNTFE